ncbi:hypothetical protein B0O99DRAFT_654088 [Bisporella sp. PMI_857]|nr:hypothetical protein B0O99DRAFT_654088 [Bisporella sp. PMI_857]
MLAPSIGVLAYSTPSLLNERDLSWIELPSQAQRINQKADNVLVTVPPPSQFNGTNIFIPTGTNKSSLFDKPFHVYDDEFLSLIGESPTLTLLANAGTDPLFHEAVVWYPQTDEVFIAQNAGAKAAGTGLNKSSIILKISLSEASAVANQRNASGQVKVTTVGSNPQVINPNGATNYKGQILYMAEGQGADIPSALVVMNPKEPYNTTILLNNYYGRQFNSVNDVAVNPRNQDIYFTDPTYGYLQDFRPSPGLPNQVYRFNDRTGAVTVVADGLYEPNGITFSPGADYAYVTDTGAGQGYRGYNLTYPSSIYRWDVKEDGTWENRKLFAFVNSRLPDGVHCDSNGNVYSGCGDGVQVWNPSGKLIGKIYLGETSANFRFAGNGRMVIAAETNLYYATLAASGADYIE